MTKPKRGPKTATVVAKYHDDFDRLRDRAERELFPRLDPANTADAQIMELIRDTVTCLKVRRIELSGYDPDDAPVRSASDIIAT